MKKLLAITLAALVMLASATTVLADPGKDLRHQAQKQTVETRKAQQELDHQAKAAYKDQWKLKKQALKDNHHEIMALRKAVREPLNAIKDLLAGAVESGTIPDELLALLPQIKTELDAISQALKDVPNYGELMRQIKEVNKLAKDARYDEALAKLDELIVIQTQNIEALKALAPSAQALLDEVSKVCPAPVESEKPEDE